MRNWLRLMRAAGAAFLLAASAAAQTPTPGPGTFCPENTELVAGVCIAAAAIADPPPGFWRANQVNLPCSIVQPNIKGDDPLDERDAYLRYDASGTFVSPQPDGKRAGQGGSQHTIQVYLDGMLIGLCSGLACGSSSGPREMFPAPWRNPIIPDYGVPLCDYWKAQAANGAVLENCPNPRTPAQYSAKIALTSEWTAGWPLQAPNRQHWCVPPRPTWTPQLPPTPTPTPQPISNQFDDWIYQFAKEGYTAGCGNGNYCPSRPVTRAEIAVFGLMFVHGPTYIPPKCAAATFNDVPCSP